VRGLYIWCEQRALIKANVEYLEALECFTEKKKHIRRLTGSFGRLKDGEAERRVMDRMI